jgi:hypothetical protein
MNKTLKVLILIISVFLFLCIFLVVLFEVKYIQPYQVFRAREQQVEPLYDEINNSVLNLIPPPDSVKEASKHIVGFQYESDQSVHGKQINLTYTYNAKYIPGVEILKYYDNILLKKGWNLTTTQQDSRGYNKETSCILIYYNDENSKINVYDIYIWNDYFRQSFSPDISNLPTINFSLNNRPFTIYMWDFFEGPSVSFLQCPGKPVTYPGLFYFLIGSRNQ